MKIYDTVIQTVEELFSSYKQNKYFVDGVNSWNEASDSQLIFNDDLAYELGRGTTPGISGILLTDNKDVVDKDEVVIIGEDLCSMHESHPYGRIVISRVNDSLMGEGPSLYNTIRKIDYTRYHVNPEGYMVRISPMNQKESIRVSKKAIKDNINFLEVGKLYIDAYKKHSCVENVKVIFITDPSFDYSNLEKLITKADNITKALDHLLNKVNMDCHSCKLQVVCNEVENLVNEDFNK